MTNKCRIRLMLAVPALSLTVAVPQARATVRFPWQNHLSASMEMGRYDPEPGCKKDVDGCRPKLWTSTRQFKSGSPVWMRVTVTNHSKLFAGFRTVRGSSWVGSLVDATGKQPELTKRGCWDRDLKCPIPQDDILTIITAAPPENWDIPPGKSAEFSIEVSLYFALPSGDYTLSPVVSGFRSMRSEVWPYGPLDEQHSKPIAKLTPHSLTFLVAS